MNSNVIKDVIDKAISGDKAALAELYEKTYQQVFLYALNLLHSKENAEDIVQETFITVFDKISTLKDPNAYKSWVNQIALNKIRRSASKKQELLLEDKEEFKFDNIEEENDLYLPQENFDNEDTKNIFLNMIDKLPDAQKSTVFMYYYDEMSVSDIAEAMSCSVGTVKSRLNYARKEIKNGVEGYEKKGIKLYTVGSVPLLLALCNIFAKENALPPERAREIFDRVASLSNIASAATAAQQIASQAGTAHSTGINHAVQSAAHLSNSKGIIHKIASASVKTKVTSGIVSVAMVAGVAGTVTLSKQFHQKSVTAFFQYLQSKGYKLENERKIQVKSPSPFAGVVKEGYECNIDKIDTIVYSFDTFNPIGYFGKKLYFELSKNKKDVDLGNSKADISVNDNLILMISNGKDKNKIVKEFDNY